MTKQEFYDQLPRVTRRLYTYGLGSAALFLLFWYSGGYNLWGYMLDLIFDLLSFFVDVRYESGSTRKAALVYYFTSQTGSSHEVAYKMNQLNSNLVVLVTLMGTWIHRDLRGFLRLAAWLLGFTLCYQLFSIGLQLYVAEIGPDLATRLGVYWEETTGYFAVYKLAAFDKFILRYFAFIPIFLSSLVAIYFTTNSVDSPETGKKQA